MEETTKKVQRSGIFLIGDSKIAHIRFPVCNLECCVVGFRLELMTRQQVLDLYFMEARSKVLDLAAFLDRMDRAEGKEDFRLAALREAISQLQGRRTRRAEKVLLSLSDPSVRPVDRAMGQGACGAWAGPIAPARRKKKPNSV